MPNKQFSHRMLHGGGGGGGNGGWVRFTIWSDK